MQIVVNGELQDAPEGATLADLVARLRLHGRRVAIERNGEIVPRSAWASEPLHAADRVEIVRAIGGG